jgi:predicted transcriptional regulator|tara:strand:- start:5880 stop:6050 length:171 start_codon:yes stop_codon:yes gene_type:complete
MNWNSATKEWTQLKSLSVIKLATIAKKLRAKRMSVKNIAEVLDKSESRIREYLKNV